METQETQSKLTFEQLPEAMAFLISEISEMKKLINDKISVEPKKRRPLGIYEASKIIKKEISTIYNLTATKKIPHYKRGHQLYFFEDELLAYIESGNV
jgi:hypothetical protein